MSGRSESSWERRMCGEVRVDLSSDRKIRGTAIVFNSLSHDLGGFREIIKPEAVDRTLREGLDVLALVDHDSGKIIGRTKSGTLSLSKDRRGLRIAIDPPNTSYAKDLLESVERGDISGMSFGFRVITDEWRMDDGEAIREVTDMTISEVSVVGFPAYPATDVQVAQRSLRAWQQGQAGPSVAHLRRKLRAALAK
jgi:HK97 family phage prohead protease